MIKKLVLFVLTMAFVCSQKVKLIDGPFAGNKELNGEIELKSSYLPFSSCGKLTAIKSCSINVRLCAI